MENVLRNEKNNSMSLKQLVPLFEAALKDREIKHSQPIQKVAKNLKKHLIFSKCRIIGWEIKR